MISPLASQIFEHFVKNELGTEVQYLRAVKEFPSHFADAKARYINAIVKQMISIDFSAGQKIKKQLLARALSELEDQLVELALEQG